MAKVVLAYMETFQIVFAGSVLPQGILFQFGHGRFEFSVWVSLGVFVFCTLVGSSALGC